MFILPILHIGYHKTATTWLQRKVFNDHPELVSLVDSATPWGDRLIQYIISTSDYMFDVNKAKQILNEKLIEFDVSNRIPVISAERLSGHPISGGYDAYRTANRIKSIVPNAKVLIVVRNQYELLVSIYAQMVAEGYRGKLEDLLSMCNWKVAGFSEEYLEFHKLVGHYISLLGKERVKVVCYEDIRFSHDEFLSEVYKLVGVGEHRVQIGKTRENKTVSNVATSIKRRLNHFRYTELNPEPIISINKNIVEMLFCMSNKIPGKKYNASEKIFRHVLERFKPSNVELKKITGIDLQLHIEALQRI